MARLAIQVTANEHALYVYFTDTVLMALDGLVMKIDSINFICALEFVMH